MGRCMEDVETGVLHSSGSDNERQDSVGTWFLEVMWHIHAIQWVMVWMYVEWPWGSGNSVSIFVDLKLAYLQFCTFMNFMDYQLVNYKDMIYCLPWLGFGLNITPKIMAIVLGIIVERVEWTRRVSSSYIDGILEDETVVNVMGYLKKFGLTEKPSELVESKH